MYYATPPGFRQAYIVPIQSYRRSPHSEDSSRQSGMSFFTIADTRGISGGQTGEWALVQEEQMGPLLTPGKISLNR